MKMTRRSTLLVFSLLLAALTLATFSPILKHGFIDFDDHEYIVDNPDVRDGLSWRGVGWAFTTRYTGNWHPLTWVSHLIDGELFGVDKPAGHHLHNLLLHTASALVLFGLLHRLTARLGPSLFVACIFAVHPLQVESVSWAAERKTVLAMLFWMLALLAYVNYVERPRVLRYLLMALAFGLALMSKQTVVTFPFVLLLLDYWPLGRVGEGASERVGESASGRAGEEGVPRSQAPMTIAPERSARSTSRVRKRALRPDRSPALPARKTWVRLVWEKLPLFAMTAAVCWATVWVQAQAGLVKAGTTRPLGARIENAAVSYVVYLKKMLWPNDLAVFYPHPGDTLPTWKVAASLVLLLAITLLALAQRKRRPYLIVGWLWYVGTLVPLSGLIQAGLHAMTDRHSYIPLIGLYVAIVWFLAEVTQGWRYRTTLLPGFAALVVLVLSVLSWRQTHLWKDSITLFEHTIAVTEDNDVARYNLALVLQREGRRTEAIRLYEEAVAINPQYISARLNLGAALAQEGRFDEAVEQLEALLKQKPDDAMAHHNLANVLIEINRDDDAVDHYREAMRIRPDWSQPAVGLTWVLASSGSDALRDASQAVRLGETACHLIRRSGPAELPRLAGGLDALAAAYAEAGRYSDAVHTAREAIDVARATGNTALVREIRGQRLRRYQNRRPFRRPTAE